MAEIKICGLTNQREAQWIMDAKVEYAGIVLFCESSKRNNSIENVYQLLRILKSPVRSYDIKVVAVTVSPSVEQIAIIQMLGFDYIQVHGELTKEALEAIKIPIFRAFHIENMELFQEEAKEEKIIGYVFDAKEPGSGITFDWKKLKEIKRDDKIMILAGGLNAENVRQAIEQVNPQVVDVSSGVEENTDTIGKDKLKIMEFVRKVRTNE